MRNEIVITNVGMTTPVGLNTIQTISSIHGGLSGIMELDLLDDMLEPISMGHLPLDVLPYLEQSLQDKYSLLGRQQRMLRLAAMALEDLVAQSPNIEKVPMYLALPKINGSNESLLNRNFFENLAIQTKIEFNTSDSKLFGLGRAGFFWALEEAMREIQQKRHNEIIIVGGVDSYLDPYLLSSLCKEGRLLRMGVQNGFRPGEGVSLLLLLTLQQSKRMKLSPMASVKNIGKGNEQGHMYSDKSYQGEGLAQAFEELFKRTGSGQGKIETVYAGFNGEAFFAKEWGVAFMRNRAKFADEFHMEHPAEYIGDAGAALPPVMCALAAAGFSRGLCRGPALVFASSDEAERGVALLAPYIS